MSNDNEVLENLIGALSSNTTELNNLIRQVAAQADTLNEVKRHSESVKKSVDWANLGDDVYEGVAEATTAKIEETVGASAKIVAAAQTLGNVSRDQQEAVQELRSAITASYEESSKAAHATNRLNKAAEDLRATYRGEFARMALVAALTASLSIFGGYWWAKSNVRKDRLADIATILRSSNGETYCADMGGSVLQIDNGGSYCATWIKTPEENSVE